MAPNSRISPDFLVRLCLFLLFVPDGQPSQFDTLKGGQVLISEHRFDPRMTAELRALLNIPNLIPNPLDNSGSWPRSLSSLIQPLNINMTKECGQHVTKWMEQLAGFSSNPVATETWALQMVDSWGKVPEGILSGHVNSMGDYDECVGIKHPEFQGHYCTSYLSFDLPSAKGAKGGQSSRRAVSLVELANLMTQPSDIMLSPSFASCFPSSCSQEEIQGLLTSLFAQNNVAAGLGVTPFVAYCSTGKTPEVSSGVIAMIVILSVLAFLCFAGTILEIWRVQRPHGSKTFWAEFLLAFSAVRNTKALLSTTTGTSARGKGETMTCFYGLRFLSIAWVMLYHTWEMLLVSPSIWNLVDAKTLNNGPWTIYLVVNGLTCVDTFFLLAGLLVSYNLLKALKRSEGKFNVPLFYLHRYLRLTPAYAFIIGFLATIWPLVSSGPLWFVIDIYASFCRKNWWQNILYINNFIKYQPGDGMCANVSWYLSVDMQLFIISPLLVYPLYRWEKLGRIFLGLCTLGSVIAPLTVTYVDHMLPTPITSRPYPGVMDKLYLPPWSRAGPYLVGVWVGYFLFKTSGRKLTLPKIVCALFWCISTATALAIIFGIHSYFNPANEIPRAGSAIYAGFHRLTWGLVVAWIVIACVKELPGSSWVNSFLSWSLFAPLSRLTFCMYLISYYVQMTIHLRMRQPLYYDAYTMVNLFFCNLLMTILISFVLTISIEMPFIALDKLLFPQTSSNNIKQSKTTNVTKNDTEGQI